MFASWSICTIPLVLFITTIAKADVKPYISTEAEYWTECKTCPRSLCPNKLYYGYYDQAFNVTCWTRGTKIMGDRLWLKSEAGCYVTQYDVVEYTGDYKTDLAYCGRESEEQHLTIEPATTKYKTECRICPELTCDTVAYLPENTDLDLTCWTPEGQVIIDDPYEYWMKTTNNCYVAQKNLYSKPDITYLESCGPIPFLETLFHYNENGTSDVNKRDATPEPLPKPADLGTMYLVNATIGEEYAYCRSCPEESCKSEKRYKFDQEVWVQCVTTSPKNESMYWDMTTDFCYVKDSDFWQSPTYDSKFAFALMK
ncbi:hypothetical protein GQ44DRAFT_616584 [Phaeosphaeriaceae sp. PMI808]|nr:hypothetical protein GQ44DRAFT_616584 [Phaeosphaeriaceae sp. PMI808]